MPKHTSCLVFILVALSTTIKGETMPSDEKQTNAADGTPAGGVLTSGLHVEPNPPPWPSSVLILDPNMSTEEIRSLVAPTEDSTYTYTDPFDLDATTNEPKLKTGHNSDRHFTEERRALLFRPGTYTGLDVEVGYYVQLAGLGGKASDVLFEGCRRGPYVDALNKREIVGGRPGLSLDTFWRAAENFAVDPTDGMMWAVSQAAPLRRCDVRGDLYLHDEGAYSSGGVLANAVVAGDVDFGSQQQYLCRSVEFRGSEDMEPHNEGTSAWNHVYVDCVGDILPDDHDGSGMDGKGKGLPSVVRDDEPNVVVEKPFVAVSENGSTFTLRVPKPRVRTEGFKGPFGPDLDGADDDIRDFSAVKLGVATAVDELQAALDEGKDVVLAPGIFHLDKPLVVRTDNQVILGLGLATLVAPTDGSPCIRVSPQTEGVRIAGIMLEASEIPRDRNFVATLLEWGTAGVKDSGNPTNPGVLTDVFARVGGSNPSRDVATDTMVVLHSGNVLGDNLWLWRADHVALRPGEVANFPKISSHYRQTVLGECPAKTGLEVNGDDVTIHGLAVEHTTEHQTVWRGERGNVQFYQCELPYDVNHDFAQGGFLGYHVENQVREHVASGVGVYSNFRDHPVETETAIRHPVNDGVKIVHAFTVKLDNHGLIRSVSNGIGPAAREQANPTRIM